MIATPTVFVLGAGASAPYEFPTDLNTSIRDQIAPHDSVPSVFRRSIAECGPSDAHVVDFAIRLRRSGLSVDEFIAAHPDYREVGKLAIARAVAPWEDSGRLDAYYRTSGLYDAQRWYHYCFRRMLWTSGQTKQCSITDNKLTVVTFNFDRSFERALYEFVLANCVRDFDAERAKEIVGAIPVLHIHGQLGRPPWLRRPSDPPDGHWRDFGSNDFSPLALKACAGEIKIVDEEVEGDPAIKSARDALCEARRVCFLGFSYNPLNLHKLRLDLTDTATFFGTTYGLSKGEKYGVETSFRTVTRGGRQIDLHDGDVLSFLKETNLIHD